VERSSVETEITTLESGIRVATQPRYGKFCTVGVVVGAGSRYEANFPTGVSHIIEKLGFMSSTKYPSRESIFSELEKNSAICDCQTSRDATLYAISTEVKGVPNIVKMLSNIVHQPRITEDELNAAKMAASFEVEDLKMRPEQEGVLLEMIHAAAWRDNTLGFPRHCPPENLDLITRDHLLHFMRLHYSPERIVVAGVGVDHQELIDITKAYFSDADATWNTEKLSVNSPTQADRSVAKYSGGMLKEERDFGIFNAGPLPVPDLAHIALGFESIPHHDPDFIASCVLNLLMGGGGSFSAGGPGKGMYSRLYTNVLNQYHWIYNATAYHNSYNDSGLFSIYASSPPHMLRRLVTVLIRELLGMKDPVKKDEFQRAKVQLKSMLLMNLESRPVVFEDIGRQILANGFYKTPAEYINLIDKVREEDVERVARRILESKPSFAALGNLADLPTIEDVTADLAHSTSKVGGSSNSSRFNFFQG
jgi:processing peptidase subunit alpha